MAKSKVVFTGAAGKIAGQLRPFLAERYDLALLDVRTTGRDGQEIPGIQIADLTERNRDAYREHFRGADAVVHCGFVGADNPSDPEQRFQAEFANVGMAYNVYKTALEEGVRRVVVASSNHAADYYEGLILQGAMDFVDPNERALSDNYYGWAKETHEHLGFVFAVGKAESPSAKELTSGARHSANQNSGGKATVPANDGTRPLENVQIRIGGPRETDLEQLDKGDLVRMRRSLAVYISDRDMAQLFIKSIETEDIRDAHGVPFQIFYGISDNSHAFWSIVNAREVIDYQPQDNSERRFSKLIAEHIEAAEKK